MPSIAHGEQMKMSMRTGGSNDDSFLKTKIDRAELLLEIVSRLLLFWGGITANVDDYSMLIQ